MLRHLFHVSRRYLFLRQSATRVGKYSLSLRLSDDDRISTDAQIFQPDRKKYHEDYGHTLLLFGYIRRTLGMARRRNARRVLRYRQTIRIFLSDHDSINTDVHFWNFRVGEHDAQ